MTPPTTKEHARPAVQKTSSAAPTRQRGKETAWRRLAGSLAKAQELLLQIRAVAEAAIDGAPQAKRELQALAACVGPLINTDPEEGTSLAEIFGLLKQLDAADIPAPDARPAKYATGDKVRVSAQAPKIYTQTGCSRPPTCAI